MPTAMTHAFVGAVLARSAPAAARGRALTLALVFAAVLPDLDVIGFWAGIPYASPWGHRGFSHSLLFAGVVGFAIGFVFAKTRPLPGRARWGTFAIAMLACASHGALDAFTDAGLGVGFLIPWSDARSFFPWRPVATSPLSVEAFFSDAGLDILVNEFVWVWVPVTLVLGGPSLWRRWSKRLRE